MLKGCSPCLWQLSQSLHGLLSSAQRSITLLDKSSTDSRSNADCSNCLFERLRLLFQVVFDLLIENNVIYLMYFQDPPLLRSALQGFSKI